MKSKQVISLLYGIPDFVLNLFLCGINHNNSKVASIIRRKIYNTSCMIDTSVYIQNKRNFVSGYGSWLYHACYILNSNGKLLAIILTWVHFVMLMLLMVTYILETM